jgi:hypothetical protein
MRFGILASALFSSTIGLMPSALAQTTPQEWGQSSANPSLRTKSLFGGKMQGNRANLGLSAGLNPRPSPTSRLIFGRFP